MSAVWVGPTAPPELLQAVTEGGGQLVDAGAAQAFVWYGGSVEQLRDLLHPGVHWVQLPAAGVERWVEAGVVDRQRTWTSAAGCYAPAVAEHALSLVLAAAKQLPELARATTWTRPAPRALSGATVGIVGAGGIGRELIRMLAPFGCRVLAVTRSGRSVPGATLTAAPDGLHDVLRESDYVVVAAPATAQTAALIGKRELELMKDDAWLVNVARGALVDTEALAAALAAGRIGGAALDVTDPEPLPDGHPLWSEPRALVTPHSANPPSVLLPALVGRVRDNVERFAAGQRLTGVVDLDRGY
ncbi:MAG: NAD(P)-dependent oxidoreductase [Actinomycetes bacterium]